MHDRLQAAQTRLKAALLAGEATAPHRDAIDRLRIEIDKRDNIASLAKADQRRLAAEGQKSRLQEIIAQCETDVQSLAERFKIPTNEENTMQNPEIQNAASALQRAEAAHEAKHEPYRAAADHVATLRQRLAEAAVAGAEILAQRRDGTLTERDAAGALGLIRADEDDLRALLAETEPTLVTLAPRDDAINAARQVLDQAVNRAKFVALTSHVRELEAVFCASIDALYMQGRQIGMPAQLSSSWQPDTALRDAVTHGQPPGGRR